MTQEELAKMAGISARSVAGYEAGSGARPGTVRRLASALEVEVSELTRPKGEAPPSYREPTLNDVLDEERRSQKLGQDWSERVREIWEFHEDALKASFGHARKLSTIGEEDLARDVRVKAIRTFKAAYMYVHASFDDGRRYFPDTDMPELAQAMAEWRKRAGEVEKQRPAQIEKQRPARRGDGGKVIELKEWRRKSA